MDQEDPCTIWYTLSAADNHRVDLHRLLYGKRRLPEISDPIKLVRWKNMSCGFLHIVNMFFCKFIDNLFCTIFVDAGITCK